MIEEMRRTFVFTCLLVAALACSGTGAGAAGDAPWPIAATLFHHIADDTALPDGASPLQLAEDGEGFLWEGSDGGLARYDGYHFRLYTPNPALPGSLPDNTIRALHTDPRGRLWIGTNSGGLARYDAARDRFVSYPAGPGALASMTVAAIADDGSGGLWVGTNGGLDHLDPASGRVRHLRHLTASATSLPDDEIRSLLRDRSGALWVGTHAGLVRLPRGSTQFTTVRLPLAEAAPPDVSALLEDAAGFVWIGTHGNGAFVAAAGGTRARAIRETGAPRSTLEMQSVTTLAQGQPGEVWVGTLEDGIVVVDARSGRTRRIRHDPIAPSSPADDSVQVLYRDPAGLLWVGTDRSLSFVDTRHPAVSTVFGATGSRDGLRESNVRSVLAAQDGRVWLGLAKNGVDIIAPAYGRVAALRPAPARAKTGWSNGRVYALSQARAGEVFLGTDGGLLRANAAGGALGRVTVPGRDPTAPVWALWADGTALWLGAETGLWEIDAAAQQPATLLRPSSFRLTDDRVTVLQGGAAHALWIGTEHGLNHYDPATRRIERYVPSRAPGSLASGFISCLFTDPEGRLWVGTQGGGIDIADVPRAGGRLHFRNIGVAQGLPNANVDKLLADRSGHVWASTDDGLAIVDENTLAVRALGPPEGVAIAGYWLNAGTATHSGQLLFGGLGGLTVVRPALQTAWTYRPRVVFTDIRVGGVSIPAAPFAGPLGKTTLRITPGRNSVGVDFSALDYAAPERIRFSYMLDGFDRGWTYADATRRTLDYTNLPPGTYALHVRATTRDGTWLLPGLTLPIVVLPAWFQTDWFQLIEVLAVLTAVGLLIRVRTGYLRRNQLELERLVADRTAQLQRSNAELAASTAALAERQRQLEQLAYLDVLTGLPNRRMFGDSFHNLVELMARHRERTFALLLIDLDRFKDINDNLGHAAGDALLAFTAARLRAAVRQSDIVARFGGDEFAVLLVEPYDAAAIETTCRRIVEALGEPVPHNGSLMVATPSIGVAMYPHDGETQSALYRSADLALYEAKRTGRNTWRWYLAALGT